MSRRERRGGARRSRSRPTPKWLLSSDQMDRVAQARCLLVLNVLSGESPVSEAIREAGISRGNYYQMETRALRAMLLALSPARSEDGEQEGPGRQLVALKEKVKRLEQAKRRAQRLLAMTRKVVKAAPVKLKGKTRSTRPGRKPSRGSKEASLSTATSAGASMP